MRILHYSSSNIFNSIQFLITMSELIERRIIDLESKHEELKRSNDGFLGILEQLSNELTSYEDVEVYAEVGRLRRENSLDRRVIESYQENITFLQDQNNTPNRSLRKVEKMDEKLDVLINMQKKQEKKKGCFNWPKIAIGAVNFGLNIWLKCSTM
ncbi:hypothetical protein SNEBB_000960 [Seison nebaliae]|nr:hypothetical protein SNEBB_000960 [Seison nebaliae]